MPTPGELARAGVLDTRSALAALSQLPEDVAHAAAAALGRAADPDAALAGLAALCAAHAQFAAQAADARFTAALMAVLGASPALTDHLMRHPKDAALLHTAGEQEWDPAQVRGQLRDAVRGEASRSASVAKMRAGYRRWLIGIVARDVVVGQPIHVTWRQLSDLADAALAAALDIACAQHPADSGAGKAPAVVALGKCGAQELNYVSDVDVVFVVGDDAGHCDIEHATRIAGTLMEICSEASVEGELWTVDANLRPEGRRGALVRTLSSFTDYYQRWAQPWEFQALLKARVVCGDTVVGEQFVQQTRPFVWTAGRNPGYIAQARHLRQRAETEIDGDAAREIKLGPGGLRDVEFSVQLLQLVHGCDDESLRVPGTLQGLTALAAGGYIGRDDAAALAETYTFLRAIEHRLQLRRLQRQHTLPTAPDDLRWLGRGLGFEGDPAQQLLDRWRSVAVDARRRHEKLFYRPLLDVYAGLEPGAARLSATAARERYEALGFADPDAATRHVQALAQGVSRRAVIQRTLLPVILLWLSQSPQPDAGLLAFRRISEALGESHWYLRTLRDESAAAERLITVLGSSRWLTELLMRSPEAVAMLADDEQLQPRASAALHEEFTSAAGRHDDPAQAALSIRALRRRELLRIGVADLLGLLDVDAVGRALSDVMAATIDSTLRCAVAAWEVEQGRTFPARLSVIGLGRLGGAELGYGSDADVVFVHEPAGVDEPMATAAVLAAIADVRAWLAAPSPEPVIDIDADLRPEGRNGPLVRTLESYAAYFEQWSASWEAQAMLRARHIAGDEGLGARWESMIASVRWPASGIDDAGVREIRRIKARVESERLPRGVDPAAHLKLGPGGLSDVEWTAQLLQLRNAGCDARLRGTSTLAVLREAVTAGLITEADERALTGAWRACTNLRNRLVLLTGVASDLFPSDVSNLRALAHVMRAQSPQELREEHLRLRRRARAVMERVFYGRA
ncbi:MAG: bifunctional [glutamine synthetase] adenylyltransferase/[glutamine synthetase]-adenylyl-L-tyrosine phosphorylase [Actinomycetales bacterium]|nr:bifunctional [glutamine synthetase] adenylyltransferase/[glutamine synthetase]-adenylyl-L-tyrosine phosphorylase [Actinomycetales bacterium]